MPCCGFLLYNDPIFVGSFSNWSLAENTRGSVMHEVALLYGTLPYIYCLESFGSSLLLKGIQKWKKLKTI